MGGGVESVEHVERLCIASRHRAGERFGLNQLPQRSSAVIRLKRLHHPSQNHILDSLAKFHFLKKMEIRKKDEKRKK